MARRQKVRARATVDTRPRPGRQPEKPLALIYREGVDKVTAVLIHPLYKPNRETLFPLVSETATGPYAALGLLMDRGYRFGTVKITPPEWLMQHVPEGCLFIGYASINNVPLEPTF